MDTCVFCDTSKIATPIEVMSVRNRMFNVFEPLDPVTQGHLLVVPQIHVQDAAKDPMTAGYGATVAAEVAGRYAAANIITSIGADATQSVFHLHWHVVPRSEGDGLPLPWTPQHEKKEADMALTKHGEGNVIPDGDQQKTAGLSKEAAEELRQENEQADGPSEG